MKLVEVNFGPQRATSDLEKNKADQGRFEQEMVTFQEKFSEQKKAFQALEAAVSQAKHDLVQLQQEKELCKMNSASKKVL